MTRFGRFVEGRGLRRAFPVIGILMVACAGFMTQRALSWSAGRTVHGSFLFFLTMGIVILLESEGKLFPAGFKWCRKCLNLYTCWFLYYVLILVPFGLAAGLLRLSEKGWAVGICASFAASVLLVAVGFMRTRLLRTVPYSIALREGGKDYRIALISDLHLGIYVGAEHMRKVVRQINDLNPDVVAIAGDLIDSDHSILLEPEALSRIAAELRKIQAREGVYAVLGNHDPDRTDSRLLRFLEEAEIHLIYNGVEELERICLVGRAGTCGMEEVRAPLAEILPRRKSIKPVVVLDHDPQGIREAAVLHADLVLCGHTHRGQFFPMTIFTKLANGRDFFYGYGRIGATHSVISSGIGYFRLPVRVGTSNEVADIRLKL